MKPSAMRRVEREIRSIMTTDGERCSLCKKPLPHNSATFGGITKAGISALVAECCKDKLSEIILSGLYVNQDTDSLALEGESSRSLPRGAPAQLAVAVSQLQSHFAERHDLRHKVAKRAGIDPEKTRLFTAPTDWKTADATWFEEHPKRSHRLRPVIGDELKSFGPIAEEPMPSRHELQVLVRQLEPGKRMRVPFGRNLDMPIPDQEEAIHALFDIVSDRSRQGVISIQEAIERTDAYRSRKDDRPN